MLAKEVPVNFEKQIEELKELRRIYTFLEQYGSFELDYEGKPERLRDSVQMFKSKEVLILDKILPSGCDDTERFRHLIDNLNWVVGGQVVVAVDSNRGFIYGFKSN